MGFSKLGDANCVDLRSAKRQAMRHFHGFYLGRGTLKIGKFRVAEMPSKTPNPQAGQLSGEASGKKAEISSIIVAFTKNASLPHQEVCAALLPYITGWERIFVGELVTLTNIGALRKAKLLAIAEAVIENPPRLCRYCQSRAQEIDEYSYFCNKCGNCLNLDWNGGGN